MPRLDDTTLEKMANAVVGLFFDTKLPLTEGVVKFAQEANLNPEQVKRLVEAANNMTFLRKFEGADDRLAASEFQPADANAALSRMLEAAKDLMSSATPAAGETDNANELSDLSSDLPNTRPETPELDVLPEGAEEITPTSDPNIKGTIVIMKLRKTAELLRDQEYQARSRLTDTFQKMATHFTRVNGVPFEEFEKDAFYQWGSRAAPFLNLLRGSLRLPEADYDHTAMTKVARVVDTRTRPMREFYAMMLYSEAATKAKKGQQKVAEYLKQLEG